MKAPQAPRLETRRTREFAAELQERARAWIPAWEVTENEGDFGRALLEIAARFNSEVAERLDGAGEKMRRGFLDWLAVRREAARPSRMPVVFKLVDAARVPVLASAPVRLQADAAGTPVVFETERDVRLLPGRLDTVIGADADLDAFYLPPPGIRDLKPLEPLPTQWQLKSFAAAGATRIQLDPEVGLVPDMLIRANGQEYKIVAVDKDLVTIDPPLATELSPAILLTKVTTFSPFAGARNWQAHVLYLGDSELLNIEAAATIEVVGPTRLREGFNWEYWGKRAPDDAVGWQRLTVSDTQIADGVALEKPKGAVEMIEIGGQNSRWLRAHTNKVDPSSLPITSDKFSIRVNAAGCRTKLPCPAETAGESPVAEGLANATPLVLDNVFFPLGKEPRQFDAFYLGSQEAFSKTGAEVQLCFEMADSNFAVLSALKSGALPNQLLAGVAADEHLHLFSFNPATASLTPFANRQPLRPPSPKKGGEVVPDPPVKLERKPRLRPPLWSIGDETVIGVSAAATVWTWRENKITAAQSGWENLGEVGPVIDQAAPVTNLVYLADAAAGQLLALRDSLLFIRDLNDANAQWKLLPARKGLNEVTLTRIAPIGIQGTDLGTGKLAEGFIGVATDEKLYGITLVGLNTNNPVAECTQLLTDAAPDITPAAIRRSSDDRLVAVAIGRAQNNRQVLGFLSEPGVANFTLKENTTELLEWGDILGGSIDVGFNSGQLTFAFCAKIDDSATGLSAWTPFSPPNPDDLFNTTISSSVGLAGGAPALLPQHIVVPTTDSRVIIAEYNPNLRTKFSAPLKAAAITDTLANQILPGDSVAYIIDNGGTPELTLEDITDAGISFRGRRYYELANETVDDFIYVYRQGTPEFDATIPDDTKLKEMQIDIGDAQTKDGSVLRIQTDNSTQVYEVTDFAAGLATLDRDLDVGDPTNPIKYKVGEDNTASIRPMLKLDNSSNNWDAALLDTINLRFEAPADPSLQKGFAFKIDINQRPLLVALENEWVTPPPVVGNQVQFLVDGAVGAWVAQLGDTSSNPELSWEYWNGTGWSKLHPVRDETLNFKRTGRVEFKVPEDLKAGDWAGKTNFWIRARLIGGDYGKEKVTVTTVDKGGGVTEQTVDRSLEGIRPPSVLKLQLAYAICTEIVPTFLLTQDSGTIRNQSDANRTPGAIVEAFVPLALTLGRLSKNFAVADVPEECPPECSCAGQHATPGQTQPDTTTATIPIAASAATGRSLFIGLAATPSEAPINVLLLVEERNHTAFAPVKVEALIANSFQPVVVDDTTRALGESGLLSLSFPVSPTPSELFGKTLTWLRLVPKLNATDEWIPAVRGAYLNAAWASATETLTRELLGSSDGAPNLRFRLARPPVLRDTLELRVREPLGEEEREALVKIDPNKVVTDANLPGDWVLWTQVVDPNDEPADARVYALDEATGELRFGDGIHGRIPPIGRDAIVAFSYSRTETGDSGSETVPGNTIGPRTTLNLVSPVETVEAVTSADQAAGGAPSELDERVLRFGFARLRHRNRAVTARDLEDLALQSSPDIVQARAVGRRGFLKLVIVMRGDDPQPTAAQVRELRRLLLEAAPAALSAPGALRIEGPKVRRLQIELALRLETLDNAGELGEFVKLQLKNLFDSASGGIDNDGWPLGLNPTEDDIAFALIDAPHLESIGEVKLRELVGDEEVRPWPDTLKETEIVMLAGDPVRIEFETAEVLV